MKKTISLLLFVLILSAVAGFVLFGSSRDESGESTSMKNNENTDEGDGTKPEWRIVAVGDSLTAGYNLPVSESYPQILENKLREAGANVEVINAGISGETTAGLLERAEFISRQSPDLLLITTGGNDAFRNLPLSNTKENIRKTLEIFKQSVQAENIYLLQIESTANLGSSYRNEFNAMYAEIATAEGVNVLPFVVREVFLDPSKMLSDGIHPNKTGYEFIVEKYIFPVVNTRVKR